MKESMNENMLIDKINQLKQSRIKLGEEISKQIVGQEEVISRVLIGLFAGGHILIE